MVFLQLLVEPKDAEHFDRESQLCVYSYGTYLYLIHIACDKYIYIYILIYADTNKIKIILIYKNYVLTYNLLNI